MISRHPSDRKKHWESIYASKRSEEVSWYQKVPTHSLELIRELQPGKEGHILDVGGGDSLLVDHLLDEGYQHISVLDLASGALDRSRERLGERASKVTWLEADVVGFVTGSPVDLWHDRAAFHFLTDKKDIEAYLAVLKGGVAEGGHALIATFSKNGPTRCSGIDIRQYDAEELTSLMAPEFELVQEAQHDHLTPSGAVQNFLFAAFRRRSSP